ncbi:serine/threonine protein kinase [Myxococcota bacterium]|nr:serine/threonine protein kinase [Myxococcota bacterium]MBU1535910.1 serine/threonine protein kinase [Myxococcota bacterium]
MDDEITLIGETIGHYEITAYIGKGSMGEVYLGIHPKIGRKVAVKVLASYLCARPDMVQRFTAEAESVNRINHPNIIQVFDFGELPDGRLYLIMEYLEGKDLETILKKGPLPMEDVETCFHQLASALKAAHDEGIVHRDLKPENIFVSQTKVGLQVKILDFGIAKLFDIPDDPSPRMKTQRGTIMGTPLYMSPEQARGEVDRISPQSDIYSLAIIIYKMLSGYLPIEGPTVYKTLAMHSTDPPVPITRYKPELGVELWNVLAVALAKAPLSRYSTVALFHSAFEAALAKGGASPATPVSQESPVFVIDDHLPAIVTVGRASDRPASMQHSLEIQDVGQTAPRIYTLPPQDDTSTQRGSRLRPVSSPKKQSSPLIFWLLLIIPSALGAFGYFSYQQTKKINPILRKAALLEKNAILLEDLDRVARIQKQAKNARNRTLMESAGIFGGVTLLSFLILRNFYR